MDSLGSRGALLNSIDRILSMSHQEQRRVQTGQTSMFDLDNGAESSALPSFELGDVEVPLKEKLNWEKDLVGAYLSGHPFSQAARELSSSAITCGQVDTEMVGQTVTVAGIVASVRVLMTRSKQQPFVSATLEDLAGSLPVLCWGKVYEQTKDLWAEGTIVIVRGKVRGREGEVDMICDEVREYKPRDSKPLIPKPEARRLMITLAQTEDEQGDLNKLQEVLNVIRDHPGHDEVCLTIATGDGVVSMAMPHMTAECGYGLRRRLLSLIPEDGLVEEAI